MGQSTNHKHKISDNISLVQPTQINVKPKCKRKIFKKCNECNKRRKHLDESHQICCFCHKIKNKLNLSGNKIIDDFIRYTQVNYARKNDGKMEFVPYDQFKNLEFIAEGGFSKVYKATWIDGPIFKQESYEHEPNYTVVLKKFKNSENITYKELNELKVFYDYCLKWGTLYRKNGKMKGKGWKNYYEESFVSSYFGITQDPNTQDIMIIMPYYDSGDLINYITKDFYNTSWYSKLWVLRNMINGLINIHSVNIIHRDLHSGNIFCGNIDTYPDIVIGDFGLSKSATESTNDDNENYGIIPYTAPEIFHGQKHTKASDIYSFGMIMWELMTGRRPFWNRKHDTFLIIDICDGLRPPIVTNAPEGYIELMKECWHSNPEKRPEATVIYDKIKEIFKNESQNRFTNPTKITESSDIGPTITNNSGAIYKSRLLSRMIDSAMSIRSSRNQSNYLNTDLFYDIVKDKRKFEDNLIEDNDNYGQSIKRRKLFENDDYQTTEIELDIDI